MEMELDLDKLRAVRVLGRGAMGVVFLATDGSSRFALKVFDKCSQTSKPEADRRARWEISLLSRLSHPFLPSLLASVETPDLLACALPFCPGGDLNALRYSLPDRVFSTSSILFYVSEIVSALAHLHSLSIVYRDLKPENVLLRADGHVTLTDFDLSRRLSHKSPSPSSPPHHHHHHHRRNLTRIFFGPSSSLSSSHNAVHVLKKAKSARVSPSATCEKSHSFVGTEEYVSPEVVRGEGHEFAVDWWALGILAYEMAYGRTPFRGRNRKETFRNVVTRQPEFSGGQRSDLTDLIGKLLAKDPSRRLGYAGGAEEVKAHAFFNGVRWDLLTEVARPPFLPAVDDLELEDGVMAPGGEWFDIGEYFKLLHQPQQPLPPGPPLASSVQLLPEF
ncbi:serine/threonine-protein kinase UCN-like [Typha angustifolia]|uniref:serine/threonine-protein kinase UCN-like n=1 Tax=Typha angustifolia TaxID=59011 RepID=UPI003C307713